MFHLATENSPAGQAVRVEEAHQRSAAGVLEAFGVDPRLGLSRDEAARRLRQHGRNELTARGIRSVPAILWEQLSAAVIFILLAAALVAAVLGDYKDAAAIAAIIVLNVALGFTQEYRAEKALAALRRMAVPFASVRREGAVSATPAAQLVPGDIVLLEAGNSVPADCRVVESVLLQTLDAALTGESQPVDKDTEALDHADIALADRRNMVYFGTFVTAGRGVAVVTSTGMRTELGRIAGMMQAVRREPTPLQRRLHQLGKVLAAGALALVAVIFALGLLRGEDWKLMFLTAVSIGVAAVPEGLPAVVTIALALGAQRMLRRKALIRRLPAVETLGSVTIICTDKTGTLTENRMSVATLQLAGHSVDLAQAALPPSASAPSPLPAHPAAALLLAGGALCNDFQAGFHQPHAEPPRGDPTEAALVAAAARFGLAKQELERRMPRVAEVPFSSERKRMTTAHAVAAGPAPLPGAPAFPGDASRAACFVFTKGAVDSLLPLCATIWTGGREQPLDAQARADLAAANDALAGKGMRVIGLAFRRLEALPSPASAENLEREMAFVGIFGLLDPLRQEAAPAVATCLAAGIRPVMITGDHPLTARHIAAQLGIEAGQRLLTGPELDALGGRLKTLAESTSVYARVSPAHKLQIVRALQENGEVVAMIGDGVNDAPSLRKADIGVSMGRAGTDVAKEAADIILLDDNFATIVAAVEEGRTIYDNLRKFIRYILTTNSAEIWTMLAAPILKMPLALLPLQILWMNLVTDGVPALALGVEPAESDTMQRAPYPPKESLFARGMGWHVLGVGLLMAFFSLAVGYGYWHGGRASWQTMLFTALTLAQMADVLASRSERKSLFQIGLLTNVPLLSAVILTVALQLCLIYVPLLQGVFNTRALALRDLGISLLPGLAIFAFIELQKSLRAYRGRRPSSAG